MDQPSQHPSTIITLNQPNSNDKGLPSTKASNSGEAPTTTPTSERSHSQRRSARISIPMKATRLRKKKNRATHIQEAKTQRTARDESALARLAATSLQTPSPSDAHIPEPEQMGLQSAQTPRRHAMQENEEDEDFVTVTTKKKAKIGDKSPDTFPVIMPLTASNIATTTEKATASSAKTNLIPMTPRKNINPQPPPTAGTVPKVTADNCGGTVSITDGQEISEQARRFAVTRYPFPPFSLSFEHSTNEKTVVNEILQHFEQQHGTQLKLAGHRMKDKHNLLLFVEDRVSFACLFDEQKWPATLLSKAYHRKLPSHLPPQFSIVLRNVPSDLPTIDLLTSVQKEFPQVVNAHRINSPNKLPTTFVRLDISRIEVIDELLKRKHIYIDGMRIATSQYLAPAKVLVCSKCFQIGHFRSQCKNTYDYCKACGLAVTDLKEHANACNKKLCCVRCKGDHESNDGRCPEIKSYRAALTKSLLAKPHTAIAPLAQQPSTEVRPDFTYNAHDFPALCPSQRGKHRQQPSYLNNDDKRIEELQQKIEKSEKNLSRLLEMNHRMMDQLTKLETISTEQELQLQTHQIDLRFQQELTDHLILPLCRLLLESLPTLVEQNYLPNCTPSHPSVVGLCVKLKSELPDWTRKQGENNSLKAKLSQDHRSWQLQQQEDASNSGLAKTIFTPLDHE